jgi:PHD/YefM family antitoxin component YafN of YafNO toxin-antitoxin module
MTAEEKMATLKGQTDLRSRILELVEAQRLAQLKEQDPAVILIAKRLYPNDVTKQNAYILANSPAAVKGISATADDSTEQNMPWEL